MSNKPTENTSSHYWYNQLPSHVMSAFDACAHSPQIFTMYRCLFSERNYCVDVVEGMNEVYVTGMYICRNITYAVYDTVIFI